MTDPDDLFAGDEERSEPMSVDETDSVNLDRWFGTLQYREVHSYILGFAPAFLLLLLAPRFPAAAPPLLAVVLTVTLGGVYTRAVPDGLARSWLCKEPHYAWAGQVIATVVGTPIYVLSGGV